MARAVAWLVSVGLHAVLPAVGVLWPLYVHTELPPVVGPCIICTFERFQFSPLALLPGATESDANRLFRAPAPRFPSRSLEKCVTYQYSSRLGFTLLFRHGRVVRVGQTEDGALPVSCDGLVHRRVHVVRRPWFPRETATSRRTGLCP